MLAYISKERPPMDFITTVFEFIYLEYASKLLTSNIFKIIILMVHDTGFTLELCYWDPKVSWWELDKPMPLHISHFAYN